MQIFTEAHKFWKVGGADRAQGNILACTTYMQTQNVQTVPSAKPSPHPPTLLLLLQAQHLPLSQHHIKHYGLRLLLMSLHMLHHGLFAHTKNPQL